MNALSNWFQLAPIPVTSMDGHYNWGLVALSYAIAVLASYVAMDLISRLRQEQKRRSKYYWLIGGSLTMGAGIWTVHFIAMLAFSLPMVMEYEFIWTAASFLLATLFTALAISTLKINNKSTPHHVLSGFLVAMAILTMHYMGMKAMEINIQIHYSPSLFILSIIIAMVTTQLAFWLAFKNNYRMAPNKQQFNFAALMMGVAICLTQYIGIEAAIFTPDFSNNNALFFDTIKQDNLAFFIAGFTLLIIGIALTASTYYKQMVSAVRDEKEFLNAMLDNLEDGIIACDDEGKITVFNQALQKNIKLEHPVKDISELPNLFSLYSMNNELLERQDWPLTRVLNGEQLQGVALIVRFHNEIAREVVIDGQPIHNTDGKKIGAVTVIHDVTELKRTEKLKNEFVSIVSHELRTPLTSIRGSLGLLVNGVMGVFPEKAQKLLEIANNNCERLLLLINDILDIEKIEAGKMTFHFKTIDLNSMIRESIDANRMYAEKFGLTIQFFPPEMDSQVNVDPDRLMQVLANLISNACKFSPAGARVILSVESEKDRVRVSVADQGSGIPLEFQSRIFQKFSQADSSDTRGKGGTGLGLNISKTIIEKFGGSLNFSSNKDEGTTFYFTLPILIDSAKSTRVSDDANHKQRLLICEDDDDQSQYLKALLEPAGFTIDIANTVAAAKKLLAIHRYKALLLDLILPDQDGIGFIRELKASDETSYLHIIVLSVIAQTGKALLNGDALSVIDWLDKPVDFNTLLASINRLKKKNSAAIPSLLHIEDNIDTQHVVEVLLENHAKTTPAHNLQQARILLEKNQYDLVILDLLLPDGNGSEILPLLAKKGMPVLVFSDARLGEDYASMVSKMLVKSNSSNDILLNTIINLL